MQCITVGNATCDLGEVIASSAHSNIQKNHLEEVLKTYHDTFKSLLWDLNVNKAYGYEELFSDYQMTFFRGWFKISQMTSQLGVYSKEEIASLCEENKHLSSEEFSNVFKNRYQPGRIKFKDVEERFVVTCKNAVDYGVFPLCWFVLWAVLSTTDKL